jgi:hypothetical protein
MNRTLPALLCFCASVSCSKPSEPSDTTGTEITRTVLERAPVPATNEELRLMLMEFPPGASSPRHQHPAPGVCYVIQGVAESQYEGEPPRRFRAGESYRDTAKRAHVMFRNPSATEVLRFTCAATLGKDESFFQPL